MKHLIAIEAKFLPPTNFKCDRIKMTLPRWENKSKTISYDYQHKDTVVNVETFLNENNITPLSYCETKNGYTFLVSFDQVEIVLEAMGVK